ncbi:LOW QUALITY PROTEIN: polygalacturonase At1g48100 [Diospyros lotus]|uniref:LOW QUALITY PROTEIN: polygalacturonase At1g48100 n=1 Tax=Diospyros lotus TaxID=55363 RepID=UPI0022591AD6|nr:LOW QUALITY PROTEIN: polygalacturonase At1g48100 [Diospyros lotus]
MTGNCGLRAPASSVLIALLVGWFLSHDTACMAVARRMLLQDGGSSPIFDVLHYGAKGDGATDDTKAFEAAWAEACKVKAPTVVVPSGSVFLLKPISFSGTDCESNIVFQLDGKILAPTSSGAWGSGLLQWLEFTKLKGITIRGKGVIDGQGSVWWNKTPADNPTDETELGPYSTKESNYSSSQDLTSTETTGKMPSTKPTALRFYGSSDVTVTGITIQNSPQTHLKFDSCTAVQVFDLSVSSPSDSPNTDGIHLQNSHDVVIYNTNLACGDDCVSIQTGCSGVYIHDLSCGPGHGISIGGLGKEDTTACVSNITVRDTTIKNTLTGVRIKTWQGGSGSVQGIMFSNIQVSEVQIPIVIDQFYCDGHKCNNATSAVAISGVSYQNIKGTYTEKPVYFACSDSLPCSGITLTNIELKGQQSEPFCWETYGELKTTSTPPIDCLKTGKPPGRQPSLVQC